MTVTRLTIRRGDVELAVTDQGGDGPPLLLLHGLAGSSRELEPTARALTGSYRALLMDQRGHGHSTRRPEDLSRVAYVDDVVAVLDPPSSACTNRAGRSGGSWRSRLAWSSGGTGGSSTRKRLGISMRWGD